MRSRRPVHVNLSGLCRCQSKMQALIVCRFVATCGCGKPCLSVHLHASPKPIAIAARATQGDGEPMRGAASVHKNLRMPPKKPAHAVHRAIIVQIAEASASARY